MISQQLGDFLFLSFIEPKIFSTVDEGEGSNKGNNESVKRGLKCILR